MTTKEINIDNAKVLENNYKKLRINENQLGNINHKSIPKNISYISNDNIQINPISKYNEDDYCSFIYNKPISKMFFQEKLDDDILFKNKSLSCPNSLNNKNLLKNDIYYNSENIVDKSNKIIDNCNYPFEEKIRNNILLEGKNTILKNGKNFDKNITKILNIFNSMHKILYKKFKSKNFDNFKNKNNRLDNNIKPKNLNKKKYSKKLIKHLNKYESGLIQIHNRNATEFFIDLNHSKNKIIKLDEIKTILEKRNNCNDLNEINNTLPKNVNYKVYDAYIMNSNIDNNMTEREKEIVFKENKILNKSMKKIDTNINKSIIDDNLNINKLKIQNYSINYNIQNPIISERKKPKIFIKLKYFVQFSIGKIVDIKYLLG